MSDIANAVCVDDTPQSLKQRCFEEEIRYTLLTTGLRFGAIVVCRTAEDAARLLEVYGDRARLRGSDDHC